MLRPYVHAVIPRRDPARHRHHRRHTGWKFRDDDAERVVFALDEARFSAWCVERVGDRLLVGSLLHQRPWYPHTCRTHGLHNLDARHHLEPPPVVGEGPRGPRHARREHQARGCRAGPLQKIASIHGGKGTNSFTIEGDVEGVEAVRSRSLATPFYSLLLSHKPNEACHPERRRREGPASRGGSQDALT